jgi:hypothetical protein
MTSIIYSSSGTWPDLMIQVTEIREVFGNKLQNSAEGKRHGSFA